MSWCSSLSPLENYLKSQSPQELFQAKLKPKDPLDPKAPDAMQNPLDPTTAANKGQESRAAVTPGTGLVLDISA